MYSRPSSCVSSASGPHILFWFRHTCLSHSFHPRSKNPVRCPLTPRGLEPSPRPRLPLCLLALILLHYTFICPCELQGVTKPVTPILLSLFHPKPQMLGLGFLATFINFGNAKTTLTPVPASGGPGRTELLPAPLTLGSSWLLD